MSSDFEGDFPYDVRIRECVPQNGGWVTGRILTTQTIDFSAPHSGIPTLMVKMSSLVVDPLPEAPIVDVEVFDGGKWFRPENGRFILSVDDSDGADPAGIVSFQGIGFLPWLLQRARIQWSGSAQLDGTRTWRAATPGRIVISLLDEAKARGWGQNVQWDFTVTTDSNGDPWAVTDIEQTYQLGIPYAQMLDMLLQCGLCEMSVNSDQWYTQETLRLFNPGHGVDYSTGSIVKLSSTAATRSPLKRSIDNILTAVTVQGEGELRVSVDSGFDLSRFANLGRLEGWVAAGGVDTSGAASSIGQVWLNESWDPKGEQTFTYDAAAAPAELLPWIGFNPGDWVLTHIAAPNGTSLTEKARVIEVILSKGEDGTVSVTVITGDRFNSLLPTLTKRQTQYTKGSGSAGSGVAPSPTDGRSPKSPLDFAVIPTGYWDADGAAKCKLALSWAAVTEATQGTPITVDQYEVWSRPVGGIWSRLLATTTADAESQPLDPGLSLDLRVRARSKAGVWSDWSLTYPAVTVNPAGQPLPPTTPELSQDMGAVIVAWDGQLSGSVGPVPTPKWIKHIVVEQGDGFDGPWRPVGQQLTSAGFATVNGIGAAVTAWFQLRAVDRVGNVSDPTAPVEITIDWDGSKLADMAQDVIDATATATAAYEAASGAAKITWSPDAPTVDTPGAMAGDVWWQRDVNQRIVGQWEWSGTDWVQVELSHEVIASLDLGKATVGELDGVYIKAGTIRANQLVVGSSDNLLPEGEFDNGMKSWQNPEWFDPTGGRIGGAMKVVNEALQQASYSLPDKMPVEEGSAYRVSVWVFSTVQIPIGGATIGTKTLGAAGATTYPGLASNTAVISPNVWTQISGIVTVNVGAVTMGVYLASQSSLGTGTTWFDSASLTRAANGQLIVDGAIDGKTITGAVVRTAASGARVQLDTTGLRAFNAAGTVVTSILTSTGQLSAVGSLSTGTSGQRVEVSSTTAKFYNPGGYVSTIAGYANGAAGSGLILAAGGSNLILGSTSMAVGGSADLSLDGSAYFPTLYNGGGSLVPQIAKGTGSLSVPPNSGLSATITLPAGVFSGAPNVVVSFGPNGQYFGGSTVSVWSVSATSLVIGVSNTTAGTKTHPFTWVAMQ